MKISQKNWMKNSSGITLIALVITIIVLLILAGVSLSLIMGNDGILGRAENAVTEHQIASTQERLQLEIAEMNIAEYEAGNYKGVSLEQIALKLATHPDYTIIKVGQKSGALGAGITAEQLKNLEYIIVKDAKNLEFKITEDKQVVPVDVPTGGNGNTGGSTGSMNGMYSVSGITADDIAPRELFDYEIISGTENVRITGMNSNYIKTEIYYENDVKYYDYYRIDDEKLNNYCNTRVGDTLVVPYEIKIDDVIYPVTEVSLQTDSGERWYSATADTIGNFPSVKTIIYPNTVMKMLCVDYFREGNGGDAPPKTIEEIVLSNNLTEIPNTAFHNQKGLKKLIIPSKVTSIGENAFSRCEGLESITIPSSVTSIGNFAFYSCTGLTSVYFNHTTAPTVGSYYCFSKYLGSKTTFYFKNSTVADALIEGTHYEATYGEKSDNYNW